MILLKAELVALADTGLEGLRSAMQAAIELEHATLPPYMYALYSIRAGTNVAASRILRSIVMQEMVHLTLCCNILNAIGGVPVLNKPNFIPPYPGPLPGGIDDGLQVPLAPLSLTLVHDAFMVIEEPEDPLEFPVVEAAMLILPAPKTIGQFYARIKEQLQSLAQTQNIFTGDASRQLTSGLPGVKGVNDLASAMAAIDLIVVQRQQLLDQGECHAGTQILVFMVDLIVRVGRKTLVLEYVVTFTHVEQGAGRNSHHQFSAGCCVAG